MPHAFPKNFSPIPAHVEHDVTFDVHSHRIEWDNPFWDRKVVLNHCGCEVTLPQKAKNYGVTATWHFIFAEIDHPDCKMKYRTYPFVSIVPEAFAPSKEEIGRMLRHDDPFQGLVRDDYSNPLRAMDGCEIAELESVCEHGLPSWPLYLDYLPTKWNDVHHLLPKGTERPESVANRAFSEASKEEQSLGQFPDSTT